MAVAQQTPTDEPTEQPISTKTRIVIETLAQFGHQLEDVSKAVQEIQTTLRANEAGKGFIVRAVKQWLSLVDPNWRK